MQLEFNIEKKGDCIYIGSLFLDVVLKNKLKQNKSEKTNFSCHT
jgi:hypothetical protein